MACSLDFDLISFEDDVIDAFAEPSEIVYGGHIATIKHDRCFGFVKVLSPDLPARFGKCDVYFNWNGHDSHEFQSIKPGLPVHFKLDDKCQSDKPSMKDLCVIDGDFARNLPIADGTKRKRPSSRNRSATPRRDRSRSRSSAQKPPLSLMEIDIESPNGETSKGNATNKKDKTHTKKIRGGNRLYGCIADIKQREDGSRFGFIKVEGELPKGYSSKGDVHFFASDVKPSDIAPKRGDGVSFVLGSRDKSKPHAVRVYVESYGKTRSESDIEEVLIGLYEKAKSISDKPNSNVLIELLSCVEVWKCVANYQPLSERNIEILVKLVFIVKSLSQGLRGNLRSILRAISHTHLFHPTDGSLLHYVQSLIAEKDQGGLANLRSFLMMIVEVVPESINLVTSIIKPMVCTIKQSVEYFLYRVLKIAASQSVSDSQFEDKEWNELSLVPTTKEIIHGPLEGAFNLRPVNEKSPYASADEYLDIYFRLFRADCFSALNKGVKDLLNKKLDHRDMNAYHSVELFGIHLSSYDMPITIGIKLTPFRPVRKWDKSRKLMFGNLVCISVAGNFQDALWATVVSRDLLQQKSVVMLELCSECNAMDDSEAIQYLERTDKRSVLVESPTYYRAYQPILKNLQRMDPETIPFQEVLVKTQKVVASPDFIDEDTTVQANFIYQDHDQVFIDEIFDLRGHTTFDKSQELAFKDSLFRKLSIIQGPPGTGKTFIGANLVRTLDSLSTKPDTPILLLTYKNHALDEFLKQLAEHYPDSIARIGGRQQDPEMAKFNLSEMRKGTFKSNELHGQLREYRSQMDEIAESLSSGFKNTCHQKAFNFDMLYDHSTQEQLENLLLNCQWKGTNIPSVLASSGFGPRDDFVQITGKKRGPKGRCVDKEEISTLLSHILSVSNDIKSFCDDDFDQSDVNYLKLQTGIKGLLLHAFKMWLPKTDVFALVKDTLNHSAAVDYTKFGMSDTDAKKEADKEEDSDDEAKVEEEERKAATDDMKGARVKLENIIKVEKNPNRGTMPERFSIPKEYLSDLYVSQVLGRENIWELSDHDRVIFVQILLHKQFEEVSNEFTDDLTRFKAAQQCKNELETLHSLQILQDKKVVGMTITGASIHCDLIAQLRPAIVVVEEAAEVMEPQLLSCLGPWVKQLILIGDHKQLRPNVESYELKRNYHLDLSLMERLINNGLEYSTLQLQNRMRPEFAEMLKDIYPQLKSNLERVRNNQIPPSARRSMYFWCHRYQECGPNAKLTGKSQPEAGLGRSYTNEEEVDRCINLALFFILQGHQPEKITILGAYLGQVKMLRKKMNTSRDKYPNNFSENQQVTIQTIDNYQGDENEIVIVSLVRSNIRANVGFLNTLNRRCVAQSRAKCAMYIIGNEITIGSSQHWRPLIEHMQDQHLVGPRIPLRCKNHSVTKVDPANADQVPLHHFCLEICNAIQPCRRHRCPLVCQPYHDHTRCSAKVDFVFPMCGHLGSRKCYEDQSDKLCKEPVAFKYSNCDHIGKKMCYQDERSLDCKTIVNFRHACGHIHKAECSSDQKGYICKEPVDFKYSNCHHIGKKLCYQDERCFDCKTIVKFLLPCGHYNKAECSSDQRGFICKDPVVFKFSCGHSGKKKCYENKNDKRCTADVVVTLSCGHQATKKCHEDESTILCKETVRFRFRKCVHHGTKPCFKSEKDIKCTEKCLRPYPGCGHLCLDLCSQPCVEDRCTLCAALRKAKEAKKRQEEEKRIKAIRDQVDAEIKAIKARPGDVQLVEIRPEGEGAAEFYDVKDKVLRYIQPMHNWYPQITRIDKIVNKHLLIKFLECKKKLFDPSISQLKFHGTNTEATKAIIKTGFIMPKPNKQMYGPGIYFATDSSKSARDIYTKGSNMLLLCDVLLGKAYTAKKARPDMDAAHLKSLRCDSLMAPRGSDVKNDEFVVYNPDQALPKFLIYYKIGDGSVRPLVPSALATKMEKHSIVPKRSFKLDDPLEMHLRIVESQFTRLANKYSRAVPNIKSIDYYVNPPLIKKYDAMKAHFEQKYGKGNQKSEAVLAFHGTASQNIASIVTNNFDRAKISRTAHGYGIYFSEFPEISTGYGNALLLCRVLPGNPHVEINPVPRAPPGCDSIAVKPDSDGRAQMLVIENPDQILPCYVIHT